MRWKKHLRRWAYTTKCVTLISNFVGAEPVSDVRRYNKKQEHIQLPRPAIADVYNRNMGGIDLLDTSTLYKAHLKKVYVYLLSYVDHRHGECLVSVQAGC